jgi:hypothetical protein
MINDYVNLKREWMIRTFETIWGVFKLSVNY